MGERIIKVRLQAFRGIPEHFDLDLPEGRSLAVLGENGTGKSTLADAVEWYFTGRIDFLAKEGRESGLRHAGASPDLPTLVEIDTTGDLSGRVEYGVTTGPSSPRLRSRENFILRGRTLAQFIDLTKGEKWKALAEILGLEPVERLRMDLQRVRNELRTAAGDSRHEAQGRGEALRGMGVGSSVTDVMTAFRERCEQVGIEAPTSLADAVSNSWRPGLSTGLGNDVALRLGSVTADLRTVQAIPIDVNAVRRWNAFIENEEAPSRTRLNLLRAGQAALEEQHQAGRCPLCGQGVDPKSFRQAIAEALNALRLADSNLEEARGRVRGVGGELRSAHDRRQAIRVAAAPLGVALATLPSIPAVDIDTCLQHVTAIDLLAIEAWVQELAEWDGPALGALQGAARTPSGERERALVDLGILRSAARAWQEAVASSEAADRASRLAARLFSAFQQHFRENVDEALARIAGRVAELYGLLHPEGGVSAVTVETWGDKGVELAVNYHGTKQRPPHRVLSESHLNSLGVVLFLAMAESFNETVEFIVLDDVMNTFDTGHRAELACLLTEQFTDRQLIVLTHDSQFFTRLTRGAPGWGRMELTSWRYDEGPRTRASQSDRLIAEAKARLDDEDPAGAAQKARVALEDLLQEACEKLGGKVPFRRGFSNDHREVGEVVAGVRSCLNATLKDYYTAVKPLLAQIEIDVQAVLNSESHAGGGSASRNEVQAALRRVEELRDEWTCEACGTRRWHRRDNLGMRCRCSLSPFPPALPREPLVRP